MHSECLIYLILSSRIRTRKRGRPCIFQHCLINCRAFCAHTRAHTYTHREHFRLAWIYSLLEEFSFHYFCVITGSVVFLKFILLNCQAEFKLQFPSEQRIKKKNNQMKEKQNHSKGSAMFLKITR